MAVGPPVMRTVLTSRPSAAKKPKSWATTSGKVPLKVGVLEAKLTDFIAAVDVPVKIRAKMKTIEKRIMSLLHILEIRGGQAKRTSG
jgi:hypothetical protein